MISSKTKIWLLLAGHVIAGVPLAWVASSNHWPHPSVVGSCSLVVAEAGLISCWGALGTTRRTVRFATVLAATAYLGVVMAISDEGFRLVGFVDVLGVHWTFIAVPTAIILGMLSFVKWRWRLFVVQTVEPSSSSNRLQFTIRHLLIITTVVAVLLAIGRGIRVAGGNDSKIYAFIVTALLSACAVELALLWASLGTGQPVARLAVVQLLAVVIGVVPHHYFTLAFSRRHFPFVDWRLLFGLQTLVAAASLLVVRSSGWRLVRGTGEQPTPPGP